MTVPDIIRDFTKFVKDFPIDIIPHISEQDYQTRVARRKVIEEKNK
jgi:hypothetical protein